MVTGWVMLVDGRWHALNEGGDTACGIASVDQDVEDEEEHPVWSRVCQDCKRAIVKAVAR